MQQFSLFDQCVMLPYNKNVRERCLQFTCGDTVLDDFYERNNFRFLHTDEVEESAYYDIPSENTIATRLMYYDLKKA